jgi:glycosyltransferase involved in cell wall biosynthesis
MASSAGVVASDLEPFHDLLQPGGAAPLGELFPRGNSRELAEATLRVLAAPNEARRVRARVASRRYDWAVIGPEILNIYGSAGQLKVRPAPGRRSRPAASRGRTVGSMINATRVAR